MVMLVLSVLNVGAAISAKDHCAAITVLPASIKQDVPSMPNSHKASLAPEWLQLCENAFHCSLCHALAHTC